MSREECGQHAAGRNGKLFEGRRDLVRPMASCFGGGLQWVPRTEGLPTLSSLAGPLGAFAGGAGLMADDLALNPHRIHPILCIVTVLRCPPQRTGAARA